MEKTLETIVMINEELDQVIFIDEEGFVCIEDCTNNVICWDREDVMKVLDFLTDFLDK